MTNRVIITAAPENHSAVVVENAAGYALATLGRGERVEHLVVYDGHDLVIREGEPLSAPAGDDVAGEP